ncbi:BrnA antitoxin family protein [Pararobbsia silviterrae]|uniref:BrnA antitoxin family protein n=1 Tax=Pararobbsia silviterrae TaxID=1792498 RepID=A0A494Y7S1_9BURK|nr:BrnA antitoxin family protein [Pararobbsia silviterrae]RKP58406.1 hypothetical protein D7S86_00080 [Pararobbsia silviterrae]
MNANKNGTRTEWVDPDDAPELTDAFFEHADEYVGRTLVRRGRPAGTHKTLTTIRFDDDVLSAFRATGKGWQTRMNDALKDWLKTHSPEAVPST